jgi:hypothetical protein
VDASAQREIVASAVAANASHHFLVHVRLEIVCLMGRRIGVHLGGIVAALRTLISVRRGLSSLGLRKPRSSSVRAPGFPICLLTDVIAGFDVYARAARLIGWIEADAWLIDDLS